MRNVLESIVLNLLKLKSNRRKLINFWNVIGCIVANWLLRSLSPCSRLKLWNIAASIVSNRLLCKLSFSNRVKWRNALASIVPRALLSKYRILSFNNERNKPELMCFNSFELKSSSSKLAKLWKTPLSRCSILFELRSSSFRLLKLDNELISMCFSWLNRIYNSFKLMSPCNVFSPIEVKWLLCKLSLCKHLSGSKTSGSMADSLLLFMHRLFRLVNSWKVVPSIEFSLYDCRFNSCFKWISRFNSVISVLPSSFFNKIILMASFVRVLSLCLL